MADVHQRSLPIFASFQRQNLQVELQHSSPLMRGLLHQIRAKLIYIVAGWNWLITIITITFKCHLCILKKICLHQATHTPCIIQHTYKPSRWSRCRCTGIRQFSNQLVHYVGNNIILAKPSAACVSNLSEIGSAPSPRNENTSAVHQIN